MDNSLRRRCIEWLEEADGILEGARAEIDTLRPGTPVRTRLEAQVTETLEQRRKIQKLVDDDDAERERKLWFKVQKFFRWVTGRG